MQIVDFDRLERDKDAIRDRFNAAKPFRWVVIENFLRPERAERIFEEFPVIDRDRWVDASGLHTKNKWTLPVVEGSVAEGFYEEINGEAFRAWMSDVSGIPAILADPTLKGAGFHQTTEGGFLDVHVDFNRHDETGLDRRLNLLVYFTKRPDPNGEGFLELWDMEAKRLLESVAPVFNRCVIFETNEISYHGHPKPWANAAGEARKSLSVYYYTEGRDDIGPVASHNTLYVNTEGNRGALKVLANGVRDVLRLGPIRRRLR